MKRKVTVFTTIVLLIITGIFMFKWLSSFKKSPGKKTPPAITRYVKAVPVKYGNLPGIIQTSGRMRAFDEINISSEVGGRLENGDRMFKPGQFFKKGELIAHVINDEFTFQLIAQKSNFLKSIANILPDMKIDYQEAYPKWMAFFENIDINKPIPDIPETSSSKERIFLATKNILNEYYSIKSNEIRYSKYFIYAPFNGTLKDVIIQSGSVVNPGAKLAVFTRNDLYELEVPVRAVNVGLLETNMKAKVINESGDKDNGYISRIGEVINPATNTINVYVTIKNSKKFPLLDGMYLNAVLYGNSVPNVMEMPRNAVYNGNKVYVLKDGKLKRETINVLKLNNKTLYFNGLQPGEMLVAEPITGITGNAKFKPLNDK